MKDAYTQLFDIYDEFYSGANQQSPSEVDVKMRELYDGEFCPVCKRFHIPVIRNSNVCKLCYMRRFWE